jgi:hypothetical protein
MAEEIFALSPIAARPVQPSEADYDAIKEAFMETSRGRWFLGEYAKRNRNADTRMVLDAVARIEETIAAQKKPVRDPLLDEALASLRAALAEARDAATAAINDLAIEQNLAPVRKGARVIREIAWRLREIGADGRICDLIDQQVAAIEGAAAKLAPSDLAAALSGAFDRIEGKIANLDAEEAAAPASSAAATPQQATDAAAVAEAPETEPQVEAKIEGPAVASVMTYAPPEVQASPASIEAAEPTFAEEPQMAASLQTTAPETASEPTDAFDANDEAVLDMVAMEMAAFDTDEAYEPKLEDAEVYERQTQEDQIGVSANQVSGNQGQANKAPTGQVDAAPTPPGKTQPESRASAASWEIDVTFASDTSTAADEPEVATALASATPSPAAPEPEPEPGPSLGSSLLANGIVPRPRASGPDPLAPIRRMTQNERIAFFS